MTTSTLTRTRRRGRREPATAPELVGVVAAALAANDPPMLSVADWGRGWWPVDVSDEEVMVRRRGQTLSRGRR
ncbi:hypothetical protein [Micromonospora costi]|uniref:Uncharacterized protein n=1 Tax=Micromonospora costi TaxID=1530042 RepID=A0A3B0A668_9ACTN|nr:hypothetical protein [Micromonospora costi]RKN56002.1 hypothetical protein D7193_15570 [Micromonospora costi]